MTTAAWIVVFTPATIFILHCILQRALRSFVSTQTIAILVCCVGWLAMGSTITWVSEGIAEAVFGYLTTFLLCHLYFHLYNMSETARRIKILKLLRRNPHAPLTALSDYSPKDLVEQRLNRLLMLGQVEQVGENIVARGKLLQWVCRVMIAYGNIIFPKRLHVRLSANALQAGKVNGELSDSLKVAK